MKKEDFEKLIEEHQNELIRYAYRLLGGGDYTADAVQEAFISFYKSKSTIANPKAWLFRVVRNRCIDYLRKNSRQSVLKESYSIKSNVSSPDKTVMALEKLELIRQGYEELNDREREVLSLKMEHSKSYKEIAEIMDISSNYVGYIMHEAMNKLKDKVMTRGER